VNKLTTLVGEYLDGCAADIPCDRCSVSTECICKWDSSAMETVVDEWAEESFVAYKQSFGRIIEKKRELRTQR